MPGNLFVGVARRRMKHPIAVHSAGAHTVLGLLAVLLTLMLASTSKHVLDENGVGVIAEGDGGAAALSFAAVALVCWLVFKRITLAASKPDFSEEI